MTPFADYRSVFQQQHSGIASDDGFECDSVGRIERIFGSRYVTPMVDASLVARRKSEETVSVVLGVFIDIVNRAEIRVVGIFEIRRDEQERVAVPAQNAVSEVVSRLIVYDGKIMNRRFVAFLYLDGVGAYVFPCAVVVGVVFLIKLALHTVFLQNERRLEFRLLGSFGYLHALLDVDADMIRAEIELRQVIETPHGGNKNKENSEINGYPLVRFRNKTNHFQRPFG